MDGIALAGLIGVSALVLWEHRALLGTARPRPRARSGPAGQARRCPYCHQDLLDAPTTSCRRCGTPQHAACWEQHGTCSVHGCGDRRRVRRPPVEADDEPVVAEPVAPAAPIPAA